MSPPPDTTTRVNRLGRLRRCLIIDDREREVELLNPFRLYLTGRDDVIERPVLKSIVDDGAVGGVRGLRGAGGVGSNVGESRKLQLSILFAIALFMAMAYFAFVPEYRATNDLKHSLSEAVRSPVIYFALGYGLLILPWQFRAERRIRRRHITKALLDRQRCPHCGYNLDGLASEPDDGATVCPECASAWKLDEASVANRAGDDQQATREMVRFGIYVGIVMTIGGLGMALFYIF